ncbi:MAG: ComEC/Rec2 family competence protein [Patescibacteria group bacterium]|nr:ComEC/Rec2 family competence protein [Patescibacteria group bacterium]
MRSKSKWFLAFSLIFLLANFVWLLYFDQEVQNQDFAYNQFYVFNGLVKKADKKLAGWNLTIEPQNLENYLGRILLYGPLYPQYQVGDVLEIACKVYQPEPIADEFGREFFYDKYLAKDKIYGTCSFAKIKVVGQEKDSHFYLLQAKQYFWNNLNSYLPEPASSLAKAMLLADRREIPAELRDVFAQVGLSHIIAISGLHIAIIVYLLQSFLLWLGFSRKRSFVWLLSILFFYLYLIAFPSSAVRASLMVMMVLLGPFFGRNSSSISSLFLAADIFVLINRQVLLYDIGFQLSFLAVLGLLYFVKFFQRVLVFIPKIFKLREVMSVTLAAQVFTWPLIVYYFGIFSLIAPLANFLILPFLPLILLLSMALAIFGLVAPIAWLISWPLFICFKLIVTIAAWLAGLPYAYLQNSTFSATYLLLALFFMGLLTLVLKPQDYE